MTDPTPLAARESLPASGASPLQAGAPKPRPDPDWPTIAGVLGISTMGVVGLLVDKPDAKDIAIAAVSALAGWIAHRALP